jgi:acyl dehydratase
MTVDVSSTPARVRWEEIVGREYVGDWFHVDADRVTAFEYASYFEDDGEPDSYPDGLVEGFHLLALLDHFGRGVIEIDTPDHVGWNYGLNRVRFVSPVHVGDRLRLRATVTEVTPKGDTAFLVSVSYIADLDGGTRPAFTAEMIAFQRLLTP